MTETKVRNLILWVAKIATLIISAPATLSVVESIYATNRFVVWIFDLTWLVQVSALIVVEGAFLYSWQLVQDNKNVANRDEREQNVYVGAAWFTYFLLLFVGFMHGEGAAALILRAAMGILLFIATNDKLATLQRKVEKDITTGKRKTRRIVRAQRKADEEVDLVLIEQTKQQRIKAIEASRILLEQTSLTVISDKILALTDGNVVEGVVVSTNDVVDEEVTTNEEQNAGTPETNAEPETTKEEQKDFVVLDSDCYQVFRTEEGFVVACKQCEYRAVKLHTSKNAYLSASRAGAKHCGQHMSEEEKQSRKKKSTENNKTQEVDDLSFSK